MSPRLTFEAGIELAALPQCAVTMGCPHERGDDATSLPARPRPPRRATPGWNGKSFWMFGMAHRFILFDFLCRYPAVPI